MIVSWNVYRITRGGASMLATTYGPAPAVWEHVIVQLTSKNGLSGWGEATPLTEFNGETASTVECILRQELLPALTGEDCLNIAKIHWKMERAAAGNYTAKTAVDMALYDLAAKELGVPESVLLGGSLRQGIPINRHIGITTTQEAVDMAFQYKAQGYTVLKMKIGLDPEADIERINEVRRAVGPDMKIRVDANQGYDYNTASRVIHQIRDAEVEYMEQPVRASDWKALKQLRSQGEVAIGADESMHSLRDAVFLAENECADVFVIKLIKCGGLFQAKKIADFAEEAGIRCVVTSVFDTQIGAAHCYMLAAGLKSAMSCDLTCFASQETMAGTAFRLEHGQLSGGSLPGCGVEWIEELKGEMK